MKKLISALLVFGFIFLFVFSASAESFSAYGSVTDSSSQVNILLDAYFNQSDFDPFAQYIIIRVGEYDYRLFYGSDLTASGVKFLDYSRYSSGSYNYEYRLTSGQLSGSLSYSLGNYTAVGNIPGTLQSSDFRSSQFHYVALYILIAFIILFAFSLFRVRIGDRGVTV